MFYLLSVLFLYCILLWIHEKVVMNECLVVWSLVYQIWISSTFLLGEICYMLQLWYCFNGFLVNQIQILETNTKVFGIQGKLHQCQEFGVLKQVTLDLCCIWSWWILVSSPLKNDSVPPLSPSIRRTCCSPVKRWTMELYIIWYLQPNPELPATTAPMVPQWWLLDPGHWDSSGEGNGSP